MSPVLIEAYTLEQQADYPRLLISDEVISKVFPSMQNIENAPHIHEVEYEGKKRVVDKGIFYKDEEDQRWIADFFSCEPLYCLRHRKTMNHFPGDLEPTDKDLEPIYEQAINRAKNYKHKIIDGLEREAMYPAHYKKWHYLARKFNGFLNSATYLKDGDRLDLLLNTYAV